MSSSEDDTTDVMATSSPSSLPPQASTNGETETPDTKYDDDGEEDSEDTPRSSNVRSKSTDQENDTNDDTAEESEDSPCEILEPKDGKLNGDTNDDEDESETDDNALSARQKAADARAVAEAAASADAAYVPSPGLLSNTSPLLLIEQVDGPDLRVYNTSPNVYSAKSIPVAVRGRLDVPIYVTSGGSVVEYEVETKWYDVAFGIIAEREEKEVVVRPIERVDSHKTPCIGKFLVGSVPCALIFTFDNDYSWLREKLVTYKIVVTPPSKEQIGMGRRRRARSAIKAVEDDKASAIQRQEKASHFRECLAEDVEKLERELEEKKKSLDVASKEEEYLIQRVELRKTQEQMLNDRLNNGWNDEHEVQEEDK